MSAPFVGGTFAGHRVEAEAGRGGMGVVYRAVDLQLDRVVALKVIASEYASDGDFRERFKRECRLAASLSHPHIVPIYQAGEEGGLVYVTMAFIEGTDLRALLKQRGALEPAHASRLLGQVASALDAAHAAGLVHRDVKPGNVLVGEGEHVYLTDFGLTKHTGSETKMTATGMFVGTLDYIAPEQLEGGNVDARADVYSLGCVLYQLLTGQVPFPRNADTAKMWAHVGEPPPAPSETVPRLPKKFDDVIARAMAKDPAERYPSAGDLARAAEAALEDRDPDAPEHSVARGQAAPGGATTVTGAARPRARSRRGLVAGLGTVALLAAGGAALALSGGGGGGEATAKCNAAGGLGTAQKPMMIYAGLSLQGFGAKQTEATATGARMALAESGGKAGGCVVKFRALDDSTVEAEGGVDRAQVRKNARRAANDKAAMAFIGNWESGATDFSLPLLNRAGLAQISPSNTDPGLTVKAPGTLPDQPEKYYPSGRRTYVRLMPSAAIMGAALAVVARQLDCSSVIFVVDDDPYSATLTAMIKRFAPEVGLGTGRSVRVVSDKPATFAPAAAAVRSSRDDCIAFTAIGTEFTGQLLNALNRAKPNGLIFAGDAIGFDELGSQMTAPARIRTRIATVPVPLGHFPASGRAFFRRLIAEYGREVYDPFAAHGYEAMKLALDAIARASADGGVTRAAVVRELFDTRNRKSILGTYSVDKNGDTTLSDHGLFQPAASGLKFDRVIRAPRSLNLTLQ